MPFDGSFALPALAIGLAGVVCVRLLVRYVGARGGMSWLGHGDPDDEVVEF